MSEYEAAKQATAENTQSRQGVIDCTQKPPVAREMPTMPVVQHSKSADCTACARSSNRGTKRPRRCETEGSTNSPRALRHGVEELTLGIARYAVKEERQGP